MSESLAVTVDSVARVLRPRLPWLREVLACERLSGGASQETWRLRVLGPDGAIDLALRRVPGGAAFARNVEQIGPVAEARLLRSASRRARSVISFICVSFTTTWARRNSFSRSKAPT